MQEDTRAKILVVNNGSQYVSKIESSLREIGYRSAVLGLEKAAAWLAENPVRSIILSGGPQSVNDADAKRAPQAILDAGVPILAVCYGMQDVAERFGSAVASIESQRGYSRECLVLDPDAALFAGLPAEQEVWASHGDSVLRIPAGFEVVGCNPETGGIAALHGTPHGTPIWCVQFHPEVRQTRYGKAMLRNFVENICGLTPDWKPKNIIRQIREEAREALGNRMALVGASGGVDSTTTIALLAPVLGSRLHAVLIDGGQLREGEAQEARRGVEAAGAMLTVVDARVEFARAFGTHAHGAEETRTIFRRVYAEILMRSARRIGRGDLSRVVLIQGTLAPDCIESGMVGGDTIKTHHNVGLPTEGLAQWHPLKHLFKYEVRALAGKLGLPKEIAKRHPFPGPGNFIRLPGLPKTPENLAVAAWAYARVREVLERYGWYRRVSQLVVAYGLSPTVGVKGDARVYEPVIVVRAIKTTDFMTAEGIIFPPAVIRELATAITRHKRVSRLLLDPTNKPPATTEFE